MKKLALFLTLIFLCSVAVFTLGRNPTIQPEDNLQFNSDPEFTCKITGSDKDGFDITVSYTGEDTLNCKVTCEITLSNGHQKSWPYNNLLGVRKTSAAWVAGEAGKEGAPFQDAKIKDSSCK